MWIRSSPLRRSHVQQPFPRRHVATSSIRRQLVIYVLTNDSMTPWSDSIHVSIPSPPCRGDGPYSWSAIVDACLPCVDDACHGTWSDAYDHVTWIGCRDDAMVEEQLVSENAMHDASVENVNACCDGPSSGIASIVRRENGRIVWSGHRDD